MMLRPRAVVTSLLVAIPATAAITWAIERVRVNEREVAVTRIVASQINEAVRERCESDPTWFLTGPLVGRPPGGVFVETHPDELPPRPRVEPQPFELFAYDERLVGSSSATPRLSEDVRRALRSQPSGTPVVTPHVTEAGTGVQVAMATGWIGGPCTYLVGRLEAPPNQRLERVLLAAGIFVVSLLVAMATTIETTRRIRRLARDARGAADANYSAIAPDNKQDELSSLAFVINDASQALHDRAARIEDLNESLRRFVRMTDEEVVRPLSALEGRLATLSANPAPLREDVRDALRQANRLSGQVENLMAAARLRLVGPTPPRTQVDLTAIASRVAERYRPLADAGGVALRVTLPAAPLVIDADEPLVERAIANVVDNALRYTHPGCEVTVALKSDEAERRFRLWVTDNGPGVSEEHFRGLTAVHRFRGDEGRNRRPGAPGLGLSVTREVCDRYGLRFDLKRPGAGGLEAEFSGPVV